MLGSYQKTNFNWMTQQLGQRLSEWLERQFSQGGSDQSPIAMSPEALKLLFWSIVVGLGVWGGWAVVRLLAPYWFGSSRSIAPRLVTHPTPQTSATWLRQAQALYRQGNYPEACRSLYIAMVQRLDETQRLPNQSSRTDGEFFRAVASFAKAERYQTLIATHEALCFGDSLLSDKDFQRCYQAFQEIEAE